MLITFHCKINIYLSLKTSFSVHVLKAYILCYIIIISSSSRMSISSGGGINSNNHCICGTKPW